MVQGHYAVHTYLLESTNKTYRIMGEAPVYSDVDDITSNQVKGCVVLAMSHLLTAIVQFYGVMEAIVKIYCDNDEALCYRPLHRLTYTTMTKQDMDIKMEMQHI